MTVSFGPSTHRYTGKSMTKIKPKTGVEYTVSIQTVCSITLLLNITWSGTQPWVVTTRVLCLLPHCLKAKALKRCAVTSRVCDCPLPMHDDPLQAWPVVQMTLASQGLKSLTPEEAQALARKGWTLVDVRLESDYDWAHAEVGRRKPMYSSMHLERLCLACKDRSAACSVQRQYAVPCAAANGNAREAVAAGMQGAMLLHDAWAACVCRASAPQPVALRQLCCSTHTSVTHAWASLLRDMCCCGWHAELASLLLRCARALHSQLVLCCRSPMLAAVRSMVFNTHLVWALLHHKAPALRPCTATACAGQLVVLQARLATDTHHPIPPPPAGRRLRAPVSLR